MMKVYAEGGTVGTNPRARSAETEGQFLRQTGASAFGRIEAVNGRRVVNRRRTPGALPTNR